MNYQVMKLMKSIFIKRNIVNNLYYCINSNMIFVNDINYIFTRKSFKLLEKFYNETVKLLKPVDIKRSAELLYYKRAIK